MTSEAWEKAVEAGGEALCRTIHPGRFSEEFDYWRSKRIRPETKEAFRKEAADCLRTAFPILAEELVKVAEANMHSSIMPGHVGQNIAAELRARIEQMKEQS